MKTPNEEQNDHRMLINGGGQLADEIKDLNEIKIAKKKVFLWLPIYQRRIMNEIVVVNN